MPLAHLLNRLAKILAFLFRYDEHPLMFLPSCHTGDQNLICSLPTESLEQSCLHHNGLIWCQHMKLQLLSIHPQHFTFVQVIQHPFCDCLVNRSPPAVDSAVRFLNLSSRQWRHHFRRARHTHPCLIDFQQGRLGAFWRKKRTAIQQVLNHSPRTPTNKEETGTSVTPGGLTGTHTDEPQEPPQRKPTPSNTFLEQNPQKYLWKADSPTFF